jgi:hypothetical protein
MARKSRSLEIEPADMHVNDEVMAILWHALYDIRNPASEMEFFGACMEQSKNLEDARDMFAKTMLMQYMDKDKQLAKRLIKAGIVEFSK